MSSLQPEQSPESWERALELFDRLLGAKDPEAALAEEPDPEVRSVAKELWKRHKAAETEGFLEEPPRIVRGLWQTDPPTFEDGSLLVNGRFLVVRLVGQGGMGEVYLARDRKLEEDVAIKTVRRRLASDPVMRKQFITEIQIARRVNHRNVCRIYDLFDDVETPFFSMEYLPGEQLTTKLADGSLSTADRKSAALQLAEGLAALHERGLIHRDFKPANVIFDPAGGAAPRAVIMDFGLAQRLTALNSLRGGTLKYMAPEVSAGGQATVRSDIFAFGKVLDELLPGDKWAQRCQAENPAGRPESLDPVVRHLQDHRSRRDLLTKIGGGALAASVATIWLLDRAKQPLFTGRLALALNGFQAPDRLLANSMKRLLVTALNQSPMLRLIPDDTLKATLARLKLPRELPVERRYLRAAASERKIPLLAEASISPIGSGLRMLLHLFDRESDRQLLEIDESVRDQNKVQLAEKVAMAVRKGIGESGTSLSSSHTPLEQALSGSPEAVDLLVRGIEEYDQAHRENALLLFEKAIQRDKEFALAYAFAGLASAARFRVEQAVDYYTTAHTLSKRAAERDQLWIERCYYNITGDFDLALAICRKLTTFYPDESIYQRHLAYASARVGQPRDSIKANQIALDLNPRNEANRCELVVNLAQANRTDDALKEFKTFRDDGTTTGQLDFAAGLAHMCAGKYVEAAANYEQMKLDPDSRRQALLFCCAPLIVMGRFSVARSDLERDLSHDEAATEDEPYHRLIRHVWLAYLGWFTGSYAAAQTSIEEALKMSRNPGHLQFFREAGVVSVHTGNFTAAEEALNILKAIEAKWPSTHTKGSRLHLEGAIREARGEDSFDSLNRAHGLWGDPLTMSSMRDLFVKKKRWVEARDMADRIHQDRGRIFKHFFPGLFTLNQIARARILKEMSLFEESLREYQQLMELWHTGEAGTYPLFLSIRGEADRVRTLRAQGVRHD